MDDLVIDTSVAIKWFFLESLSAEARRILDAYEIGSVRFLAPDLLNAEFGNILWKKHLFQGLAANDADDILIKFRHLRFTFISTEELLPDAYQIAVTHKHTVYDSLFLALAVREGCQIVTADEKLVRTLRQSFPNVVSLLDWP